MSQQNALVVRRVIEEIWNRGNYDIRDDVVAAAFDMHLPTPGDEIHGPAGIRQAYDELRAAFPDVNFTIDDLIATGDRVVARWTATGAHDGEFAGMPPTGRKVSWTGIDIDRVAGGRVVECWTQGDQLGLMRQLGAFPAPEMAAR